MAGRPESDLDPDEGPVQRLAFELRTLRAAAGGPTYREMAASAGCGASTLSQAASGDQLPTLAVVLAYAAACGGDPVEWEAKWRAAARDATDLHAGDGEPPYRGLERFEPAHAGLFFGRDDLVAHVAGQVRAHRLVAVVGASGSGKSSLLRAGLIPALRREGDRTAARVAAVRVLTPGPQPLPVHTEVLTPADGAGETVVVVDQFEELFTLWTNAARCAEFIDLLVAATGPDSRLRVVIAVRADFFARCADHQGLAGRLREATVLVGPMGPEALREAIVRPATAVGLVVERALTARIVREVAGEPAGLPLMSHALLETWRRRHGRTLTEEMYEAAGGIRGAIARTAEEVCGRFSPSETETARRMLLRLVTPGEGTQDTRHPADRAELDTGAPESRRVLERLVAARLLQLDGETVDLAHEALITAWPRLHEWVDQDRERLLLHRRLTDAAVGWDELARDPGALYRGTRLQDARAAFSGPARRELTRVEGEFLDASVTADEGETQARVHAVRRRRTLTSALAVVLALAVGAGLTALDQVRAGGRDRAQAATAQNAVLSQRLAAQSGDLAGTDPDLSALLAVAAYRQSPTPEATNRLLTVAAGPLRSRRTMPVSSVAAAAFAPDGHTVAVDELDGRILVWDMATGRTRTVLTDPYPKLFVALEFGRAGHTLAVGLPGKVVLWDVTKGRTERTLSPGPAAPGLPVLAGPSPVTSEAFSPDGRTLAVVSGGRARLWDTATGRPGPELAGTVTTVAYAPDGRTLAAKTIGGAIHLVAPATGATRSTFKAPPIAGIDLLMFAPDGRTLAENQGDTVLLWDPATGRRRRTLTGPSDMARAMAFSPDSGVLAVSSDDGVTRLWNTRTLKPLTSFTDGTGLTVAARFAPGGRTLLTAGDDRSVRTWNTTTTPAVRLRLTLPGPSDPNGTPQRSLVLTPDGRTLITERVDGSVQSWSAATGRQLGDFIADPGNTRVYQPPFAPSLSPDGRTLVTFDQESGRIQLWDVAKDRVRATHATPFRETSASAVLSPDGRTLAVFSGPTSVVGTDPRTGVLGDVVLWTPATGRTLTIRTGGQGMQQPVVFSPDGRTLATDDTGGHVRLWNTATGRPAASLRPVAARQYSAAFSTDGRTLVTAGEDGAARLWNVADGSLRAVLQDAVGPQVALGSVGFSPDGRTLATGRDDGTIKLWQVSSGRLLTTLVTDYRSVHSLAFSPDGHTLATGGEDGTVRLWDVATGYERATLAPATKLRDLVASLVWSRDGRTLAADSDSGTIRLWDTDLPSAARAADAVCRAVGHDLTARQWAQYLPGQPRTPLCGSDRSAAGTAG